MKIRTARHFVAAIVLTIVPSGLLVGEQQTTKVSVPQIDAAPQGQSRRRPDDTSMLDMTFPEFENAVSKTDVVLLPLGSIEEHGTYLPLSTDAVTSLGQMNEVQRY